MKRASHIPATVCGFTLIEVMIALSMLVAGLVVTAGVFSYATERLFETERESRASVLVMEKLESLRRGPLVSLAAGGSIEPDEIQEGYSDYPVINPWESASRLSGDSASLLRLWEIGAQSPIRIRVAVYALSGPPDRPPRPLAHGTTVVRPLSHEDR